MSIVKYLNGHIPIIRSSYNHIDSFFQQDILSSHPDLPNYSEELIDKKRFRKQKAQSFHEKTLNYPLKIKEVKRISSHSRFNLESPSFTKPLLSMSNDCEDKNMSFSFTSKKKFHLPNINNNNNDNNENLKSSPMNQSNSLIKFAKKAKVHNLLTISTSKNKLVLEKTMNFENFKERLNSLQKSEASLGRTNFLGKVIRGGKCQAEEIKILKEIYSEKELRKILKEKRKHSINEKLSLKTKQKRVNPVNSPQMKPMMRVGPSDPIIYMKYKKKAKSFAISQDELKNIKRLAEKIMNNIKKLRILNNYNEKKSSHDIFQLIHSYNSEEITSLKLLLLENEDSKKLNPNLNTDIIFQNFFFDNFIFNDPNANKESLALNNNLIRLCEKFKSDLKELIFEKKVTIFKKEKDKILNDHEELKQAQNIVIGQMDIRKRSNERNNFNRYEKLQGVIGKHNCPYDIAKVLKKFEVNHGALTIDKRKRIMGEVLNDMIFEVKSSLISMDENDQNIFYSIN